MATTMPRVLSRPRDGAEQLSTDSPDGPRPALARGFSTRTLLVLLLCWWPWLSAATLAHPGHLLPRPSDFENFSDQEGLSQVSVPVLLQDRQGFLWMGTADGLNRWDGYEFEIFYHRPNDSGSLSHRRVLSLLETPDGGLWVGTAGGLDYLAPGSTDFRHARHDPGNPASLSHDVVRALARDSSGFLWVGTGDGLTRLEHREPWRLSRWDLATEDDDVDDRHQVNTLLVGRSGELWVGTEEGLRRLGRDRSKVERFDHHPGAPGSLAHPRINTLAQDSAGNLWIGTAEGLDRLPEGGRRFSHHLPVPGTPNSPSNDVRGVVPDGQGRLWVATQGGLFLFDPGDQHFWAIDFESDPSPAEQALASILVDRSGALWLGTWVSGIYRYDPVRPRFGHFFHRGDDPDSLASDMVYALAEDSSGTLWVGMVGGGLDRFDPETGGFVHYRHDPYDPDGLGSSYVRCLLEDRRGHLWVGTRGAGLDRLDPSRRRFDHFRHDPSDPTSLRHDRVLNLAETSDGRLWIGTPEGLDSRDPDLGTFEHHEIFPETGDSTGAQGEERRIMTLHVGRGGGLWIGTRRGLHHYDAGRLRRWVHQPGKASSLSHDHVWGLYQDIEGILWIGTGGGGLNRFDPDTETFIHFSTEDGLGNDAVYSILEDDSGRLWLSTNRGMTRFDPARDQWLRYDLADGLQALEFNLGAALAGRDGTFYFGGVRGFNAFHPEDFRDNPWMPPVVVTSFQVLGRGALLSRPSSGGLQFALGHREGFFSFEFAALSYTRADKNRYAYRLEGLDDDWIEAGTQRLARYTNVPPGEYTFRVRGSNNDGLWNGAGASLDLVIVPPWWKTPWAYSLYVLTLAGLTATAVLSQRHKLERQRAIAERERTISADLEAKNAELERFTYTVSHDLKNPLVTIKNYLGAVRHRLADHGDERLSGDLDRIERASSRMQQMIEELLELSRIGRVIHPPEEVALEDLAREAVDHLASGLAGDGVEVAIADHLPQLYGDRLRLLEALVILIENACKFMGDQEEPRIEIGSRDTSGDPVIYVRDNGIGIEPKFHDRIFGLFERLDPSIDGTGIGLTLAKRIIEAHEGHCWVESAGLGHGSTFCFTLPDIH